MPTCTVDPGHVYPAHHSSCPWCARNLATVPVRRSPPRTPAAVRPPAARANAGPTATNAAARPTANRPLSIVGGLLGAWLGSGMFAFVGILIALALGTTGGGAPGFVITCMCWVAGLVVGIVGGARAGRSWGWR